MFDPKLALSAAFLCLLSACSGSEAGGGDAPDDDKGDGDDEAPAERDAGRRPDASRPRDAGARDAATPPRDAGPGTAASVRLPCDVQSIVSSKCGTCHGEDPSAPVSLVTAKDFQAENSDKRAMYASVKDKINATDPRDKMPPAGNDELTEEELATLNAWLDEGAPADTSKTACNGGEDEEPDAGEPEGPWVAPSDDDLTCYKLLAHNGDGKTPLAVGLADDVYYAYVFAAPWKDTSYGMVVRSIVDNKQALHHWLLFQDNVPGIPTGAVPQIGAHPTGQLLAAWAPGADPMDFRSYAQDQGGVGLELPANTTYTVEFHYNSTDAQAKDASGVEVCVANRKPKNIAAYSWLGYDNLGWPSAHWQGTCRPLSQEPIKIISFMPHMHLQGIHMKGTINRADGTKEVVHDKPFDFNFQRSYAVDLTMNPGDSLTTDCTFAQPMTWGQPTDMEMCYLFAMAYPKGALASIDAWGTVAHGSSSCLGQ